MPSDLLDACLGWFDAEHERLYREGDGIDAAVAIPDHADAQEHLLARFGRRADWAPPT